MKIITFFTLNKKKYYRQAMRLEEIARSLRFDFEAYSMPWLKEQQEYKDNRKIFDSPRGAGYWAWKPLIILDALKSSKEVLYLDASMCPVDKTKIQATMEATRYITVTDGSHAVHNRYR